MNQTADRVACTWLAVIASEVQWKELLSIDSLERAKTSRWVVDLGLDPAVVLEAAAEVRARRSAFEGVREILGVYCPSPPCWDDCLRRVTVEQVRMYYVLKPPPQGTSS